MSALVAAVALSSAAIAAREAGSQVVDRGHVRYGLGLAGFVGTALECIGSVARSLTAAPRGHFFPGGRVRD